MNGLLIVEGSTPRAAAGGQVPDRGPRGLRNKVRQHLRCRAQRFPTPSFLHQKRERGSLFLSLYFFCACYMTFKWKEFNKLGNGL